MYISPAVSQPLSQYHQEFNELLKGIAEALQLETTGTLPSLMKGNAGIGLFFTYYYLHTRDEAYLHKSRELTNDALSYLEKIEMPAMFASGFPGIAWLVKHQANLGLLGKESDILLEDIDDYVYQALPAYLQSNKSDVFYGYAGLTLYLLERDTCHRPGAIAQVQQQLETSVQEVAVGAWWKNEKEEDLNFGLAHGLPGILKFICHLGSHGALNERLLYLLGKSAAWLSRQAFQTAGVSVFPNGIKPGQPPPFADSRLAWCYGDLGVALALVDAQKLVGDADLYHFNDQLLDRLASRPVESAFLKYDEELRCYDNCLCHGTAGITYLYFKLFLKTGHDGIYRRLQEWITVLQDNLAKMLSALKALPVRQERILQQLICCDDYNLLHGISGAGLVLMGMQSPAARKWDHIFLMD